MQNARRHDSVIQKTRWKICTSLTVQSFMKLSRLSRWSCGTDRQLQPVLTAKIPIMAARHRQIRQAHRTTKSQNLLQSIRSRDVIAVALRTAILIVIIGSEPSRVTGRTDESEKADLRRLNVGRIDLIVAGTLTNGPRTMMIMTMMMMMRTTAKALCRNGLHLRSIMKNRIAIKSILAETVITTVAANAHDHVHVLKIKNTPITGISPSTKQICLVTTWFTPYNN